MQPWTYDIDPNRAVKDFENELCEYTGARFAVAVNSCTNAVMLACALFRWKLDGDFAVAIPKRTYIGVVHAIVNARLEVEFRDEEWSGGYQLHPLPIWDYAKRFTKGMFRPGEAHCVSFHCAKILGHSDGGAILHDDANADAWFRRARNDGRRERTPAREDTFDVPGFHIWMAPDVAAALTRKLSFLPAHNEDLPMSDYPDLSEAPIFKRRA